MKVQSGRSGNPDVIGVAAPLLITRIPSVGLVELQAAIDDVIWWQQHQPMTRADRIARDEAFVRLLQVRWHVQDAMPRDKAA